MLSIKSLFSLCLLLIPCAACAEDVVLYSYAKTSQKPAEWSVIPVIADLPDHAPATLFDSLKRKKMPTYGSTAYLPDKKQVQIDPGKCAYGSIISAEVAATFKAHGHAAPAFVCDGRQVPAADAALMHTMTVVPLWQALGAQDIDEPALVRVGGSYISPDDFRALLKKQDKSLIKAVEADFNDPNVFVKTGAMKGYLAHRFPNAEKTVAKELSSKHPGNVNAAMTALAGTRDASSIAQMKSVLKQPGDMQEIYALAMLDASDKSLHDDAMVILLKSSSDANFERAMAELDKTQNASLLRENLDDIFAVTTPAHAARLTLHMIKLDEPSVERWLAHCLNSETAQAVAQTALEQSKMPNVRTAAMAVQLGSASPDVAFDAIDTLIKQGAVPPEAWLRGLASPHLAVQLLAADQIEQTLAKPADLAFFVENAAKIENHYPILTAYLAKNGDADALKTMKGDLPKRALEVSSALEKLPSGTPNGAQLLALAMKSPADAPSPLTAQAYNAKPGVRRDVAYATQWLDTGGDALRMTMLKDADETVAQTLIAMIARRPAAEISLPMIKEITARSERSANLKIAVLHALPAVMNDKTVQTISTFVSNEMFDSDINVKIAAIRALSNIAQMTSDPVIADNAITSLALTAQDKSESIVHHTLMALAKTHAPSAREIIERARTAHPESVQKALTFF